MDLLRKSGDKNIINILCSGLFEIWRFSIQKCILDSQLLKQLGIFFTETTFRNVYGRHTDMVDKFDTSVSHICWRVWSSKMAYDWFPVISVNRDVCLMWGRKRSLFPECLISVTLGSSWWFFIRYTSQNVSVLRLRYGLMTGLFA